MLMTLRATAVATATAVLVTAAPAGAATDATSAPKPPRITMTISDSVSTVTGSLRQKAGPINLTVRAVGSGQGLAVLSLRTGYTRDEFQRDTQAFRRDFESENSNGSYGKYLNRIEKNVISLGGAYAAAGEKATATVTLKKGTYFLTDNRGAGFGKLRKLKVSKAGNGAKAPKAAATVDMIEERIFTGDDKLPASGTIRIRNTIKAKSNNHVYLAVLQRVADGTTAQQFQDFIGGISEDDSFLADGEAGGDALSPGRSQLLTYSLPPGTYALYCPFPSPVNSQSTYASNGMVRIVTLT